MSDGRLRFVIELDDNGTPIIKNFRGEVSRTEKDSEKSTSRMSGAFKSLWGQVALGQAAFQAVTGGIRLFKQSLAESVSLASVAAETNAKFGTVFQDVSRQANSAAQNLRDGYGLARSEAEDLLSATGDLLTGMGATGEQALRLSQQTQELAVDLASFTNYSGGAKGASEALTKAMLGERESAKQLGIVIQEKMVQERLAAEGKDKLTGASLLAAKAEITLKLAMEQSKNAIGDYARTSDSYVNQVRLLNARLRELKEGVGQALIKALLPALRDLAAWVEANKDKIIKFVQDFVEVMKTAVEWAGKFASAAKGAFDVLRGTASTNWAKEYLRPQVEEYQRMTKSAGDYAKFLYSMFPKAIGAANDWLNKHLKAVQDQGQAYDQAGMDMEAVTRIMNEYGVSMGAARKLYLDLNPKQKALNDIMEEYGVSADNAQKILSRLNPTEKKHTEALQQTLAVLPDVDYGLQHVAEQWNIHNATMAAVPQIATDTKDSLNDLGVTVSDGSETTRKWGVNWKDANEIMQFAQSVVGSLIDILGDLGVELSSGAKGLLQFASGVGQVFQGIKDKNLAGVIGGVAAAVGGLIKGIKELFGGDGVGEAIARENAWMHMTDDLRETLHKLAEEIGNTHAATSMMLTDIMAQSEITAQNFGQWADRVKEIFIDLDNGYLNQKEFAEEMGAAWNALVGEATRLGTEGSFEMLSIIREMENRGMRIAEISGYIDTQLRSGVDALQDYVMAGGKGGDVYGLAFFEGLQKQGNSLLEIAEIMGSNMPAGMRKFVEANRDTLEGIAATTSMLEALGNANALTTDAMAQAQRDARTYYKQLRDNGATEKQAMEQIAPMLAKQLWYAEQYNMTLDAKTQKMIDDARAQGINIDAMIPAQDRMVQLQEKQLEVLERIADMFGSKIPVAMDKTIRSFQGVNAQASAFGGGMAGISMPKGKIPSFAMGGNFTTTKDQVIQVHKNEHVQITPLSEGRKPSGGDTFQVTLNNYAPDMDVDGFIKRIELGQGVVVRRLRKALRVDQ